MHAFSTEFQSQGEGLNFMAQHGERLIDNGYSILPIMPAQKKPGEYARGVWFEMTGWPQYCRRPTRAAECETWSAWPNCAVGIACGRVIGIDIDVMDEEIAHKIEVFARERLGDTPAKRIGHAPKRMLVYRAETPFNGRKRKPIEVLGDGQQFVAYALHKDTQRPYTWPDECLTQLDYTRLPIITEAQALSWLDAAYAMVPAHLRPKSSHIGDAPKVSEWAGPSDPRGTYEAVKAALAYIPNDDVDGASWVRMGNAIKGALGAAGRDLWLDWSRASSKSGASGKTDTAEKRWRTFQPHSVGAGSIYWLAEERGWRPDPSITLNGGAAEQAGEQHPAAGLIAKAMARAMAAQHSTAVPPGLMDVEGPLKTLVDYSVRTAFSPQPFLALGAALATVGALAGRRYASPTGLRSNLFVIGLADSSSGKDQARKCIKRALAAADVEQYLGGEKFSAGQAIYAMLEGHPAKLCLLTEFGQMLAGITSRGSSSHEAAILTELTTLYTSASEMVVGKEYSHQKGEGAKTTKRYYQPHLCIYGDTVPEVMWKAMRSGTLGDGSAARFLIFQTPDDCPDINENMAPMDVPPGLGEALRKIADGVAGHGGNLTTIMSSQMSLDPYVVPYSPEAAAQFLSMAHEQLDWKRENRGTWAAAFIGRFTEHAIRVALIRAISRDPQAPVITERDAQWASSLIEHCLVTAMRNAEVHVADNETQAKANRVLDMIRKAGEDGITRSDLIARTRFLSKQERQNLIDDLLESKDVAESREPSEGTHKPTIRYRAGTISKSWRRERREETARETAINCIETEWEEHRVTH